MAFRDDAGRMARLLKVEEALAILEGRLRDFSVNLAWLLQDAITEDLQPDDGNPPPPACGSYTLACLVVGSCNPLDYAPTYAATLTDADDNEIDAWDATPGVLRVVTVPGPGAYTLSVEVDNANRAPKTFTATKTLLTTQCGATLAVEVCYATTAGLGPVRGCRGLPLEGATVEITGDMDAATTTDVDGYAVVPYTGVNDPPALAFAVSATGFESRTLASVGDQCCHVSPPSDPAPGGVQLTPDADHVCGCDPDCARPVKRVLFVTDDKGSCTLTYGVVGGLFGWWGEYSYSEPEGGELQTIFDAVANLYRSCCIRKEVPVTVRYRLYCDGGAYRLARNLVGQCSNSPYSFCASQPGARTGPRLTGGGALVNWASEDTYLPACGGAFSHSFDFATPDPYPAEALTGPAEVSE